MRIKPNGFNPLPLILDYLNPQEGGYLTLEVIESLRSFLELGGTTCESHEEVITCLGVLESLDLIEVVTTVEDSTTYYKVYTKNGK